MPDKKAKRKGSDWYSDWDSRNDERIDEALEAKGQKPQLPSVAPQQKPAPPHCWTSFTIDASDGPRSQSDFLGMLR